MTVARNRAIDRLRRGSTYRAKLEELTVLASRETGADSPAPGGDDGDDSGDSGVPDERLRLIFTCCHPALAMEAHWRNCCQRNRKRKGCSPSCSSTGRGTGKRPRGPGDLGRPGPHPLGPGADKAGPTTPRSSPRRPTARPVPAPGRHRRLSRRRLGRTGYGLANDRPPAAGLALVERLAAGGALAGYYLLPATRADFLRRLGRSDEAASAYEEAAALAGTAPERRFLNARLAEVRSS
jgi:hypothetical protein